jgi:hypothetical protein
VRPSTFGEDAAGELYVGDLRGGFYRLRTPSPSCDVSVLDTEHALGDVVRIDAVRIRNPGAFARPVELKLWLRAPGSAPFAAVNAGATGGLSLAPGFDATLGPFPLFAVGGSTTRGPYEFGCTLLEPATGEAFDGESAAFSIAH